MHTSEDNLLRAATQCGLNIEDDIRQKTTATLTTRDSCDAERAVVVASVLHFDEGSRAAMQAWERLAGDGLKVKNGKWGLENVGNQMILAIIRDNALNVWKFERFVRVKSRPTPCRDYFLHTRAGNPADGPTRIGRGIGCDSTRVDHSHICLIGRSDDLMSRRTETPRHGFDLALVKTTAYGI